MARDDTDIVVLGVPTSAGAYGLGQEQAPLVFREAGLLPSLRHAGIAAADAGDTAVTSFAPDPGHRMAQNVDTVIEVADEVAERVEQIVRQGAVPLVLGGDCTITLGVAAGIRRTGDDPVVAYLDGDLDLSTPVTTRSGILDAMGVAHMLGIAGSDDRLAAIGGRTPLLDGSSLALIGFEEADDREEQILADHGVHTFPASAARADAAGVARRVLDQLGSTARLIVHFDVDVIDSVDCPLAHFPHFNTGLTMEQASECLGELCTAPNLAAIAVTEVNPANDPDGSQLERLIGSLVAALSARQNPR